MIGRGLLGKWGPNHAADPLVTRYIIYLLILQAKRLFFPGGGCGHCPGVVWSSLRVNRIVNAQKSCWGTYNVSF